MSDDEVSQASSPYTSEAEEEELELEDFADQEAEAEAEEAEAELEGEAEGEGEQAEESEEEDEGDSDEESEEEEEEGEDDDAEGDEDDEEAADLEAALENMEAMDDEPQDEDEPMKRRQRQAYGLSLIAPSFFTDRVNFAFCSRRRRACHPRRQTRNTRAKKAWPFCDEPSLSKIIWNRPHLCFTASGRNRFTGIVLVYVLPRNWIPRRLHSMLRLLCKCKQQDVPHRTSASSLWNRRRQHESRGVEILVGELGSAHWSSRWGCWVTRQDSRRGKDAICRT